MVEISPFSPWKLLYWKDRVEQVLSGRIPAPVFVSIDPTNICNQNCLWCFVMDYRKANALSLSRRTMFRLIDDLKGRVPAIGYTGGGDPLMNPYTIEVINYCADKIAQVLTTNGTGWENPSEVKIVANNCKVIRVSVDAATKKTYVKVRGSNLFEKALKFIEGVSQEKSSKTEVSVSFMLSPYNYKETLQATKLFKSLGVDRVVFKLVQSDLRDVTAKRVGFSTSNFLKEESNTIKSLIQEAKREETKNFQIYFRHPGEFENMSVEHQKNLYHKCHLTPVANAGVAADGNVHLCCDRRGDLILGNIENTSFWDIWGNAYHKKLINSIKLSECPARCKLTEMNMIVERAFVNDEMMWGLL